MLDRVVSWWIERNGNKALSNLAVLNLREQRAVAGFLRPPLTPTPGWESRGSS